MATKQGSLQQQLDQLQQKQVKKIAQRKQAKKPQDPARDASSAFGINDDLDLQLCDPSTTSNSIYSEELVTHLNNQLRELKDETGRLYKLLSERDLELRQLRKKNADADALAKANGSVAGEVTATKIVNLSKRVRELSSELEAEKTKVKQWTRKCMEAEQQLKLSVLGDNEGGATKHKNNLRQSIATSEEDRKSQEVQLKTLQDKCRVNDQKLSEMRNQCQSLRQELKMAQKVLTSEVGDGVTIQSLLNTPGGWRGRNQQILALQKKVQELKSQLEASQGLNRDEDDLEAEFMGLKLSVGEGGVGTGSTCMSSRSRTGQPTIATADERQKQALRKIDRERKEQYERQTAELKALENDYNTMRGKLDASKSRNKVLATDIKSLKSQLQTLLDKGKHDDELIQALMKQQDQLRKMLENKAEDKKQKESEKDNRVKELNERVQHENNTIQQLQMIVNEKEVRIRELERELTELKKKQLQEAQLNGVSALFERATSAASRPGTVLDTARSGVGGREKGGWSSRLSGTQITPVTENDTAICPPSSRLESRSKSIDIIQPQTDRPGSTSRPNSHTRENSTLSELQYQLEESHILHQATEVERQRLAELIQVLQRRLDDLTEKMMTLQSDLQNQRKENVILEKQLGKMKVEQKQTANLGKRGGGGIGGRQRSHATSASVTAGEFHSLASDEAAALREELEVSLSLQKDENNALKAALQSTLKAKEDDLNLYNEIMEQTKLVFMEGLKQYKQKQT